MAQTWSVVMPYYNNARTLLRSLTSFATQTLPPAEIVVVDDGSQQPAAAVLTEDRLAGVPVRLLRAPHGGQSAATNVGIAAAKGQLIYLTCPDIVAPKTVLATHDAAHAASARHGGQVGVMGHIRYAPWVPMTPFMRFLSRPGPQFCYDKLGDPEDAEAQHLYAPACSVPAALLKSIGGFDETFTYGFQDTDLGLRLAAAGLRFVFRPQAQVLHDHPNTLQNFCRRQHRIAQLTWYLIEKHPQVMAPEALSAGLAAWANAMHVVPRLVDEVDALERRVQGPRDPGRQNARAVLEQRYEQVLNAAFSRGLVAGGERVRTALGLGPEQWAQVAAKVNASAWPEALGGRLD